MRDEAIRNIYPNVVTLDNAIDAYDEAGNVVNIDETLVEAEIARLQAEYEVQEYARNRKVEYDKLNQLELISDDSINGTTTHKDAILAIKAQFPKPGV